MVKLQLLNVELREERGQLRVIVESVYGVDNLGLSLKKKYLDYKTDRPKWLTEAKQLLESKYEKEVIVDELLKLSENGQNIPGDVNVN